MKIINLGVSFLLELWMLAAYAYWGIHATSNGFANAILAIGVPFIAIIIWAWFMAPKSEKRLTGWSYLISKAVLYGLAAILLASSGQLTIAIAFVIIAAISEVLAIFWKQVQFP